VRNFAALEKELSRSRGKLAKLGTSRIKYSDIPFEVRFSFLFPTERLSQILLESDNCDADALHRLYDALIEIHGRPVPARKSDSFSKSVNKFMWRNKGTKTITKLFGLPRVNYCQIEYKEFKEDM